jgi:Ala-tRNA(Pro) deacylase
MSLAETLESFLSEHDVPYTTQHHRASTSSLGTAHSAHIDEDCLAKSVVLEDERGFILAVLPASRRLELERLRDELGRSLRLTDEREMPRLFPDCQLGAVPPLGAAYGLVTVIDSSLEGRDEVFFEGGDHQTLVRMDGSSFLDLLENAAVADFASESPSLCAALVVRERLYDRLMTLGRAIAAPIGSGGTRWNHRVSRALENLAEALEEHVVETEGPAGLLREIVDQAPRLWRDVDGLRAQHGELADGCVRVRQSLAGEVPALVVRKHAHELIARFEQHRHRGSDLVYEAFGVDIGGG